MYVCMYVCMYECMYVCTYVCVYVWRVTPLSTSTPNPSYPTTHVRVTPLSTSISHCKNRYLAGFGPVPAVLCGFRNYVGSGDGVPQHASGVSEKRRVFYTAAGNDFQKLSFDVEVQITKHDQIGFLGWVVPCLIGWLYGLWKLMCQCSWNYVSETLANRIFQNFVCTRQHEAISSHKLSILWDSLSPVWFCQQKQNQDLVSFWGGVMLEEYIVKRTKMERKKKKRK